MDRNYQPSCPAQSTYICFMQAYQPISRNLYEELEMRAAFRQTCRLVYQPDNGGRVSLQTRIISLSAETDGEYLLTQEGLRLRLDRLLALDNQPLQHWA